MAVQKNFIIRNGLEVSNNLLVADTASDRVGIGTSNPKSTFEVIGGIGATNINILGISTVLTEFNVGSGGTVITSLNTGLTGFGTVTPAYIVDIRSPVSTGQTALYVQGDVRVTGDLYADDISFDQATISSLEVTGIGIVTNLSGSNLNYSGISTLGSVIISSGIITAISGVVTYYGDGQYLNLGNNSSTGIGIGTTGGIVGYGITFLDLKGAGVSTTFYNSNVGIATIFFEGGGSGTIGIGSTFPTISVRNGDLFYHINYGRTFVYYDEVTLGIGLSAFWVDASPFNVGLLTIDDLPVAKLSVSTNVNVVGVVTASAFYGDGANLTNTGSSLSAASGTQRIVVTGQTSGTMTASATDADLTFNATTNTLSVPQSVVGSAVTINSSGVNVTGVTTSTSVIVGSAVTINSSGVNATSGIVTASSFLDSAGNLRSIPQNAKTSAYNLAASDNGKHISITTGGISVLSGIFSIGDTVAIYNNSGSNQTITEGAGVTLRQSGTSNTGNRTLAQYGICTILCVASNTFVISGTGIS